MESSEHNNIPPNNSRRRFLMGAGGAIVGGALAAMGIKELQNRTGILGNGEYAFEFSTLISNWTNDLT